MSLITSYLQEPNRANSIAMLIPILQEKRAIKEMTRLFKQTIAQTVDSTTAATMVERFRVAIFFASRGKGRIAKSASGVTAAQEAMTHVLKRFRNSLMFASCYEGYTEIVKELFSLGVAPDIVDEDDGSNSLMHYAVWQKRDKGLPELLIAHGVPVDLTEDRQRRVPLHYACSLGRIGAVRALIAAGADPNAKDLNGFTPLHLACSSHPGKHDRMLRARIAVILISSGAKSEKVMVEGRGECRPSDFLCKLNIRQLSMFPKEKLSPIPLLPDLWTVIFDHLPKEDLFGRIPLVCKSFCNLARATLIINYNKNIEN